MTPDTPEQEDLLQRWRRSVDAREVARTNVSRAIANLERAAVEAEVCRREYEAARKVGE